ncbi:MAG: hypothetical protein U0R17_05225 [Acidimicrobiia bacterium]
MKDKKLLLAIGASVLSTLFLVAIAFFAFNANHIGDRRNDIRPGRPMAFKQQRPKLNASQIKKMQAQQKVDLVAHLDQLVKDSKITTDQKTKIVEFFDANLPKLKQNQTEAQRHAAVDSFKTKLDDFAKQNNIDVTLLQPQMRIHQSPEGDHDNRGPGGDFDRQGPRGGFDHEDGDR